MRQTVMHIKVHKSHEWHKLRYIASLFHEYVIKSAFEMYITDNIRLSMICVYRFPLYYPSPQCAAGYCLHRSIIQLMSNLKAILGYYKSTTFCFWRNRSVINKHTISCLLLFWMGDKEKTGLCLIWLNCIMFAVYGRNIRLIFNTHLSFLRHVNGIIDMLTIITLWKQRNKILQIFKPIFNHVWWRWLG
jgi:hypothetical protein